MGRIRPREQSPSGRHYWGQAVCRRPGVAGRATLLKVLRAPVGQRGRSGGDPAGDNVAGCPARAGAGGRRGKHSCRALSRPLCTRGRSQVQVWSARLGFPPSPSSLPFAFPLLFPPFLGRPFPLEEVLDTHFLKCAPKSPMGSFPPPPGEYARMPVLGLDFGLRRVQAVRRLDILRKTYFHSLCDDSSIRLCRTFLALCWQYATAHARHSENLGS